MDFLRYLRSKQTVRKVTAVVPEEQFESLWFNVKLLLDDLTSSGVRPTPAQIDQIRADLKEMNKIFIAEMRDRCNVAAITCMAGHAPPCYEMMLRADMMTHLCRYAKARVGIEHIVVQHIADVILFADVPGRPYLGHFKKVVEPLLDLLQDTEKRLQLWIPGASPLDANPEVLRLLSHSFIQLVYSISWQLQNTMNCACVEFFFVEKREQRFNESTPAEQSTADFMLFEFALPYLKRSHEVVLASDVDTLDSVPEADKEYQIFTTDVCVDALTCLFFIFNRSVAEYLDVKAEIIAVMLCNSIQELSLEYLDGSDTKSRVQVQDQLHRRMRLLQAASRYPNKMAPATAAAFRDVVVDKLFRARFAEGVDSTPLLLLTADTIHQLRRSPLCDHLVNLVLGLHGESPQICQSLLRSVVALPNVAPSSLRLLRSLLCTRPYTTANAIIAPALFAAKYPPASRDEMLPTQGAVDDLFHEELFYSLREATSEDEHRMQIIIQDAVGYEMGVITKPVQWHPVLTPRSAGGEPSSPSLSKINLPMVLTQRLATIVDQPVDLTVLALDLVTLMLHLNCPQLTWLLLVASDDRHLTTVQALRSLRTVVEGKLQEMGERRFQQAAAAVRGELGIGPPEGKGKEFAWGPDEKEVVTAGVVLEEWRCEIKTTLTAIDEVAMIASLKAPPSRETIDDSKLGLHSFLQKPQMLPHSQTDSLAPPRHAAGK